MGPHRVPFSEGFGQGAEFHSIFICRGVFGTGSSFTGNPKQHLIYDKAAVDHLPRLFMAYLKLAANKC